MASEVWYRKWRPQTFADVAGQPHVTRTLARAVQLNRVAHAYLFCGPRGTGKTSTARILAKAVNCEANEDGQPCGRCESCRAVTEGRALDLIEMDAASNRGIDEIRSLRDKVGYSPTSSRYKVYLIDEVHELTQFAFDALLKTLEEPPPHVIFVLATTEAHRVPETILSRCQRFDFVRIKLADVVGRLRQIAVGEDITVEDEAFELIGRRATGSLRDAVNLFEQAVASHGQVLTAEAVRAASGLAGDRRADELVDLLLQRQLAPALELVAAARDDGRDLRQLTREAVQRLRTLLLVRSGAESSLGLGAEALEDVRGRASGASVRDLLRLAKSLSAVDFRADPQSPLPLELAIVECVVGSPETPAEPRSAESRPAAQGRQPAPPPPAARPTSVVDKLRSLGAPIAARAAPAVAGAPAPANGGAAPANGSVAKASPAPPVTPAVVEESGSPPSELAESLPPAAAPDAVEAVAAEPMGVLTLDGAQRQFRELYERCRSIDRKTGSLLNSGGCDIVEIGAGTLVLGFQHANMVRLATNAAYEPFLRQAVRDVFGDGYEVKAVLAPDVKNRLQILASDRPSHLLDEALKLGAKPVGNS